MKALPTFYIDTSALLEACIKIASEADLGYTYCGLEEGRCYYTLDSQGSFTDKEPCGCLIGQGLIELRPELKPYLRDMDIELKMGLRSTSLRVSGLFDKSVSKPFYLEDTQICSTSVLNIAKLNKMQVDQDLGISWNTIAGY